MKAKTPQAVANAATPNAVPGASLPPTMMLTEPQAAEYIGMSVMFLRFSRMDGVRDTRTPGPAYYKLGRAVRYRVADLERWLEENRRTLEAPEQGG